MASAVSLLRRTTSSLLSQPFAGLAAASAGMTATTLNVAARPLDVPPRPSSPMQQPTVMRLLPPDGWVLDYLDSLISPTRSELESDDSLSSLDVSLSSPSLARETDWQALYLSPVHTKLIQRGPSPDSSPTRDRQDRAKFNGVLPYYRVWQLRLEGRHNPPAVIGRGTPSRPHQDICARELTATKLFLRDYSRRRGLAASTVPPAQINETSVEVQQLLRPRSQSSFPPTPVGRPSPIAMQTQSLSPDRVVERRRLPAPRPVQPARAQVAS